MSSHRLIEDVADTARWVAFHRALESERPDALFNDPFARRLAGERGRRIAENMPSLPFAHPGTRGLTWGLSVRTKVFDELILDSIRSLDANAVLNVAAGLDARPYRLPLPRSLVWIEADQPAILRSKTEVLAREQPACTVERIAVNLADAQARQDMFRRIAATHPRVVVITEGLLVYLDETVVGSLADELRALPSMRRWVLENISPEGLRQQMRAWGKILVAGGAPWKFAAPIGLDFFRPHRWSPVVTRSCIVEARRLNREEMRHARLLRALSRLSARFRRRLENTVVYGVLEQSPM
ncbi:MAG: class I SAM-dependent methyltransferase [Polyangiaceae bacterium]